MERIDGYEAVATRDQLFSLARDWQALAEESAADGRSLYYQASKPHTRLLKNFGEDGEGWETLHSMRSVDRQCSLLVIGEGR